MTAYLLLNKLATISDKYKFLNWLTTSSTCPYPKPDKCSFQAFAVFQLKYVPFWAIPRRLSFNSRRFGTPYRLHLHRQVDEECQ
jgi:hypothetical protein